jgi:capsule polysaccharide export protein KpsE/RkpR
MADDMDDVLSVPIQLVEKLEQELLSRQVTLQRLQDYHDGSTVWRSRRRSSVRRLVARSRRSLTTGASSWRMLSRSV